MELGNLSYAFSAVELFLFSFFCYKQYKKEGTLFLVDQGKVLCLIWLLTIGLFNLKLSGFYKPDLIINGVSLFVCLAYFMLGRFIKLQHESIKELLKRLNNDYYYKIYFWASNIIFIICLIAFIVNTFQYGLVILQQNKVNKQQFGHYTGYLIFLITVCAQVKYVLFRTRKKKIDVFVFVLGILLLLITLNRGPIIFILTVVAVYEILKFNTYKHEFTKKQKKKICAAVIAVALAGIWLFGEVGNLRTNYVMKNYFHHTINEHYQVSNNVPSGAMWVYVYLTSPLENARYSIEKQKVGYTYFNVLLYPFIKFGANVVGQGKEYKAWLTRQKTYGPHLEKLTGLNVSSFIPDSFQDLGAIGFLIYLAIYAGIAYFSIRMLNSKKGFSSIGSIVIYCNTFNLVAWSIFVNSFKIAPLLINILLVIGLELVIKDQEAITKLFLKFSKKEK